MTAAVVVDVVAAATVDAAGAVADGNAAAAAAAEGAAGVAAAPHIDRSNRRRCNEMVLDAIGTSF